MSENYIVLVAMPVYGLRRSRKKPKLAGMLERGLSRLGIKASLWNAPEQAGLRNSKGDLYDAVGEEDRIMRLSGKRIFVDGMPWPSTHTSIDIVERACGPIRKALHERIASGEKRPVVLDWGCGDGLAATRIAEEFQGARVVGFSNQFYEAWRNNEKVSFIHALADDLPRYFADNSIDIVYSRLGLAHLNYSGQESQINSLLRKLRPGGTIFVDSLSGIALKRLSANGNISVEPVPGVADTSFYGPVRIRKVG